MLDLQANRIHELGVQYLADTLRNNTVKYSFYIHHYLLLIDTRHA